MKKFSIHFPWLIENKRLSAAIVLLLSLMISIFHYLSASEMSGSWYYVHTILRRLYFLPVLLAAFWHGRKGTLLASLLVTFLFLPHLIFHWPKTFMAGFENFTEIAQLWIVGGIAAHLSDALKNVQSEKSRLNTIEHVSRVLDVINTEIMIDYNACIGLAKSMSGYNGDKAAGHSLNSKVLLERLEHLGGHLSHLYDLVLPEKLNKKPHNILKLMRQGILECQEQKNGFQIVIESDKKIPHLNIDEKHIRFAVTALFKTILSQMANPRQVKITAKKKIAYVIVDITVLNDDGGNEQKTLKPMDCLSHPQQGYAFSLALSILRSCGGKVAFLEESYGLRIILPLF